MNDRPTADGDLAGVSGILKSINIDGLNLLAAVKRRGPLEDGELVPRKNSRPAVSQSLTGKTAIGGAGETAATQASQNVKLQLRKVSDGWDSTMRRCDNVPDNAPVSAPRSLQCARCTPRGKPHCRLKACPPEAKPGQNPPPAKSTWIFDSNFLNLAQPPLIGDLASVFVLIPSYSRIVG
ncbi:hypothetical protein NUU61_006669 [Penicillium alfredii]|uniref:Uncharacterized protein n=1 Tax=Penicillium alfredii TaxID=1506179 RepID=A0A9W9K3K0_9EURO|nr:uncharacterized protein NUU61_006669 [Penicillium alfredii]KAJ5091799.1 hypothetical protein NUU61_006669 [Penicillium alfredii]